MNLDILLILLFQLARTVLIVAIGYGTIKYKLSPYPLLAPVQGRLSRKSFAWRYAILLLISWIFSLSIESIMDSVIILPSYWLVRSILFIGTILLVPFYISLVGRRLQDFSIPGYLSIPYVAFLIFADGYGVVQSTIFLFNLIKVIFTILFLVIPGVNGNNMFGPSSIKTKKKHTSLKAFLPNSKQKKKSLLPNEKCVRPNIKEKNFFSNTSMASTTILTPVNTKDMDHTRIVSMPKHQDINPYHKEQETLFWGTPTNKECSSKVNNISPWS